MDGEISVLFIAFCATTGSMPKTETSLQAGSAVQEAPGRRDAVESLCTERSLRTCRLSCKGSNVQVRLIHRMACYVVAPDMM